jgi:hypothetical protein
MLADDIYPPFFHGPAYQVVERAQVDGKRVTALLPADLPPNSAAVDAASLLAPRLVEACFQAAALWHIETQQAMAFPLEFASVAAYRPRAAADGQRLYALVTTEDDGATFDGSVVDEDGNVYVTLHRYQTVARPDDA